MCVCVCVPGQQRRGDSRIDAVQLGVRSLQKEPGRLNSKKFKFLRLLEKEGKPETEGIEGVGFRVDIVRKIFVGKDAH